MIGLDKTVGKSGRLKEQKPDGYHYWGKSNAEISEIFSYLQSVAYNYDINHPPKMDKSVFSCRSLH